MQVAVFSYFFLHLNEDNEIKNPATSGRVTTTTTMIRIDSEVRLRLLNQYFKILCCIIVCYIQKVKTIQFVVCVL